MPRNALLVLIVGGTVLGGLGAAMAASAWLPAVTNPLAADPSCAGLSLVDGVLCDVTGSAPAGALRQAGDLVQGRWVSFRVDAGNDTLTDVTARGPFADAVVFTRIQLPAGALAQATQGPLWAGRVGGLAMLVGDSPGQLVAVRNRGDAPATLVLTAAPGIAIAPQPNGTGVLLTRDGHEALLRPLGNATLAINGQDITAALPPGAGLGFAIPGLGPAGSPHGPHGLGMRHRGTMPGMHGMHGEDADGR